MSEMCFMRLAANTRRKNYAKSRHLRTIAQICRAISSQLRHVSTIGKKLLNDNVSSICLHNMVNVGPLTAEICWRVWGTPANFNRFHVLASLLHRRRSTEVNQTLHDVWPSPVLVYYIYTLMGLLLHNGILPAAKFNCVQLTLEQWRHPKFAVWYKEWIYGTFAEGVTYIRQGSHHAGHRPTFW